MKKFAMFLLSLFLLLPSIAYAQSSFAMEYAALNGKITEDGLHIYPSVELPEDNPFVYATFTEIIDTLENGTGVIYLGFPECPWCRCLVPALQEAYTRSDLQTSVLCYNALPQRDVQVLAEDGTIITEKEASPEYAQLVSILYDYLGPYEGLNDSSIRRIYFPTTVFVLNGEIISLHIDTLEQQTDPYIPLDTVLYEELVSQLTVKCQCIH